MTAMAVWLILTSDRFYVTLATAALQFFRQGHIIPSGHSLVGSSGWLTCLACGFGGAVASTLRIRRARFGRCIEGSRPLVGSFAMRPGCSDGFMRKILLDFGDMEGLGMRTQARD